MNEIRTIEVKIDLPSDLWTFFEETANKSDKSISEWLIEVYEVDVAITDLLKKIYSVRSQ